MHLYNDISFFFELFFVNFYLTQLWFMRIRCKQIFVKLDFNCFDNVITPLNSLEDNDAELRAQDDFPARCLLLGPLTPHQGLRFKTIVAAALDPNEIDLAQKNPKEIIRLRLAAATAMGAANTCMPQNDFIDNRNGANIVSDSQIDLKEVGSGLRDSIHRLAYSAIDVLQRDVLGHRLSFSELT